MAFRNLMLTTSGMILYAKAQQGKRLHLSRVAVGDGLLAGGDSMVNRSGLKSERASFLIDYVHIAASNSAAEILTTMRNDDLEDGFYFRELGIFAVDPDSGEELLYLYDNAGQDGEYIPAASENIKVIERLKMIVRLENTPDVTFTASGNPLYLTVDDIDDNAQSLGSLWSSLKISQMIEGMQNSLTGEPGQFVGFDKNGKPEAQPLPESGVGRSLAGKTVRPTSSTSAIAGKGAEIFNDYREREYDSNEEPAQGNIASGEYSHAEGDRTSATARWAHAEGYKTVASGQVAHAEGSKTIASSSYAHAEGSNTEASGPYAHAEGCETTASGQRAHAEGFRTIADKDSAHAEGFGSAASGGFGAHAEGCATKASENGAHAEGSHSEASGLYTHSEGGDTKASGQYAHAEGSGTEARGDSSHAGGIGTIAAAKAQTTIGMFNIESTKETDKLIIGKGVNGARANCFRVTHTGVYASGSHNSSGADYAELFEWLDGNSDKEDRVGRFVTLDGKYIRLATSSDDYILGIVSGNPSVVGDVYDDQWAGMFVLDVYGRPVYEWKDFPAETMEVPDENGEMETIEIMPARREWVQKLNPDYDPAQTYIPRTERPEWAAVGLLGKLVALDDGTCHPNGWAAVGEGGIATASKERTKFRVMERLDEDHIRVMIL